MNYERNEYMAEIWELYDINRNLTGILHERGNPVPKGFFHLVVDIMTVNGKGEILVTKRHPSKPSGLFWEFTGGAAVKGDSSRQAAVRELFEETGIAAEEHELHFIASDIRDSHFTDFYIVHKDYEPSQLVLQETEVVDARWVSVQEYEKLMNEEAFMRSAKELFIQYKEIILSFIKKATEEKV